MLAGSALLWGIVVGSLLAGYYTIRGWRAGGYDPDLGKVADLYLYGYVFVVGIRLLIVALILAATHESLEPWLVEEDKLYIGLAGVVLSVLSLTGFAGPSKIHLDRGSSTGSSATRGGPL